MLLSLISPNLKFHQVQFHQDHIHPHSGFGTSKLKSLGLEDEKIDQWRAKRECLPNLQLLEGKENHAKSKTALVDWIAQDPFPRLLIRSRKASISSRPFSQCATMVEKSKSVFDSGLPALFTRTKMSSTSSSFWFLTGK